ncbi:HAMP domain-containing sensor histidine kinase [Paenibacillus sp. EPM92]|uniref:sensor histidine kinase n=1 Tax=Paenibacillus sp. EPM92 TaxID=1561195 RepID=UPI0019156891|nr:HAMP domain-containing sensor histidine kinase [Paenibacillus sp. EPM92]
MIRSLYLRVVLTFLLAVTFGLIVAFFATTYVYRDRIELGIEEEMVNTAQDIAETYRLMGNSAADKYMGERHWVKAYSITIVDDEGGRKTYGARRDGETIPDEAVRSVLNGGIYRGDGPPFHRTIGYPLQTGTSRHAVFVQAARTEQLNDLRKIVLTSLLIELGVGSLFILIAARYLVQPLKLMTVATRRIAKGNFNIRLNWGKRKDELGELARSFSDMAEELKQLEQMRRDFVSNVSHEIQSPLTSISGFSKLIRDPGMPANERNQYLDIIETESLRLSRLSENLLKLASLESEHHPFHPVTFDLDEQLRRVVVALEPQWSAKELELELELPRVKITGDPDQLNQVWINLFGNAVKFTPREGRVSIRLEALTDRVKVVIADTGIGIKEEDLEPIFTRFYKADRARQRELGGSGLGLSIVRKIVELHQGSVEVQSQPGQGATFIVTLPSVPAASKSM